MRAALLILASLAASLPFTSQAPAQTAEDLARRAIQSPLPSDSVPRPQPGDSVSPAPPVSIVIEPPPPKPRMQATQQGGEIVIDEAPLAGAVPLSGAPRPRVSVPPATPVVTPPGSAPRRVQIGVAHSQAEAEAERQRVWRRHGDLLAGINSTIEAADLGAGKAPLFRIRTADLGSPAAATALCQKLAERKQSCFVAR